MKNLFYQSRNLQALPGKFIYQNNQQFGKETPKYDAEKKNVGERINELNSGLDALDVNTESATKIETLIELQKMLLQAKKDINTIRSEVSQDFSMNEKEKRLKDKAINDLEIKYEMVSKKLVAAIEKYAAKNPKDAKRLLEILVKEEEELRKEQEQLHKDIENNFNLIMKYSESSEEKKAAVDKHKGYEKAEEKEHSDNVESDDKMIMNLANMNTPIEQDLIGMNNSSQQVAGVFEAGVSSHKDINPVQFDINGSITANKMAGTESEDSANNTDDKNNLDFHSRADLQTYVGTKQGGARLAAQGNVMKSFSVGNGYVQAGPVAGVELNIDSQYKTETTPAQTDVDLSVPIGGKINYVGEKTKATTEVKYNLSTDKKIKPAEAAGNQNLDEVELKKRLSIDAGVQQEVNDRLTVGAKVGVDTYKGTQTGTETNTTTTTSYQDSGETLANGETAYEQVQNTSTSTTQLEEEEIKDSNLRAALVGQYAFGQDKDIRLSGEIGLKKDSYKGGAKPFIGAKLVVPIKKRKKKKGGF